MATRPEFSVRRDNLNPRLAELARMLENPDNRLRVQAELHRLAAG